MDLGDAHALCSVPDFRFTVTGNQHHLAHPVFRFQMLDERGAVFARRIVEAERRGVSALHKHQALQAAHQFRQRQRAIGHLFPAGYLDQLAGDSSFQTFARFFADLVDRKRFDLLLLRCHHHRNGQRAF